jgi:outer membrane protein assembly factor BamB
MSTPVAKDGLVFVGSDTLLQAFDENTGKRVWRQKVEYGHVSSPALTDDGLFVSYPCRVYRFDPSSGVLRWLNKGTCWGGGGVTPAVYRGKLYTHGLKYVDSKQGFFLNARNGAILGDLGHVTHNTPAFYRNMGFFPTKEGLTARSIDTMDVMWHYRPDWMPEPMRSPIVVNGKVIILTYVGDIIVLDWKTGKVLQTISTGIIIRTNFSCCSDPITNNGAGANTVIIAADDHLFAYQGR